MPIYLRNLFILSFFIYCMQNTFFLTYGSTFKYTRDYPHKSKEKKSKLKVEKMDSRQWIQWVLLDRWMNVLMLDGCICVRWTLLIDFSCWMANLTSKINILCAVEWNRCEWKRKNVKRIEDVLFIAVEMSIISGPKCVDNKQIQLMKSLWKNNNNQWMKEKHHKKHHSYENFKGYSTSSFHFNMNNKK